MYKLLHETVLIEPMAVEHKTDSGVILAILAPHTPLVRQYFPDRAIVLQIAKGVKDPQFKVGDTVVYLRYGAKELEEGKVLVDSRDILGVIE
uniref:Putative chaperonin n=1 Tax=viral metagenome TaxID=1070528 RepID=A0A6H1ZC38_9ZZZZ